MIEETVATTVATVAAIRLLDVRQFVGVADARLLNDRRLLIAAFVVVNTSLFDDRHQQDHVDSLRLHVSGGARLLDVHGIALIDFAPTSLLKMRHFAVVTEGLLGERQFLIVRGCKRWI